MSEYKLHGAVTVVCVSLAGFVLAAAGALYVGAHTTAPDPIPAQPNAKAPCDMNRNAVENVCPQHP